MVKKNNVFIYSYNIHSMSARLVAETLGVRRIRHTNSKFVGGLDKFVINFGASSVPSEVLKSNIITPPVLCAISSDKIETFRFLDFMQIPTLEWTTDKDTAEKWFLSNPHTLVVARRELKSHSGNGIVITDYIEAAINGLPDAPLYTKYFKKRKEFRIHLSSNGLFYVQQKIARRGSNILDWKVRSYRNGFIFNTLRYNDVPDKLVQLSERLGESIKSFLPHKKWIVCADVLWNQSQDKYVVCELNTAPGLKFHETLLRWTNEYNKLIGLGIGIDELAEKAQATIIRLCT